MKIKISKGIVIFLIAALIPFLILDGTLIGNAVYLSMGLICLTIFELLHIRYKNMEVIFKKSELIAAAVLSILLIIMISIFDILNSGFLNIASLLNLYPPIAAYVIQVWGYILYLPGVCIASFVFVGYAIHAALEAKISVGGGITQRYINIVWE